MNKNSLTQSYIQARVLKMIIENFFIEARKAKHIIEDEQMVKEEEKEDLCIFKNRPISIRDDILIIEITLYLIKYIYKDQI